MRKRSRARECALQVLYQMDITRDTPENCLANFWKSQDDQEVEESSRSFTNELVCGVAKYLNDIDAKITQYATNWQLERMAVIDRNILRISCFEIVFRADIPPKVSINEAVELAKKYSGGEAGKFVNAILDKVKSEKAP
jgi:transcription antitermination factor NusB